MAAADLEAGRSGVAGMVVTAADTAAAVGSGDVQVLATPRLIALCEAATVDALRGALAVDQTTVGVRVEFDHQRPSQVGAAVNARAQLVAVDGRRLTFSVVAEEDGAVVGRGEIVRVVVERARFQGSSGSE